jgi:uncharacterized protein (TIGR02145 family)
MKSTVTNSSIGSGLGWDPGSPGTNTSGFSALPGAYRNSNGSFFGIRDIAFFWSATEYAGGSAWARDLFDYNGDVYRNYYNKSEGASLRCLRD